MRSSRIIISFFFLMSIYQALNYAHNQFFILWGCQWHTHRERLRAINTFSFSFIWLDWKFKNFNSKLKNRQYIFNARLLGNRSNYSNHHHHHANQNLWKESFFFLFKQKQNKKKTRNRTPIFKNESHTMN